MLEQDAERRTTAPDGRPEAEQPSWRREFPIDTAEDAYVARRDFTKFLGLTSLAFVVGQFWIALQSWFRHRPGEAPSKAIAALEPGHAVLPHIPVGGALLFDYPLAGDNCLLLRPEADTLRSLRSEMHSSFVCGGS